VQGGKGGEREGGRARDEAEVGREEVRLHCPELVPRESPAEAEGEGQTRQLKGRERPGPAPVVDRKKGTLPFVLPPPSVSRTL